MRILREILENYMSQIGIKESRIKKVIEGIEMFFSALAVNENIVEDSEELVRNSGIKELVNSNERIKNMASMFNEKGIAIEQVRENVKNEEINKAPRIRNSKIKTNIQEVEQDEDLER